MRLLALVFILTASLSHARTYEIPADEIYKLNGELFQFLAITSDRSFPSGSLVEASVSLTLKDKVFDQNGSLVAGNLVFQVWSQSVEGDDLDDQVARPHCLAVDVKEAIEKVLKREAIVDDNLWTLTIIAPPMSTNPGPVRCSSFKKVEID